MTQLVEAKAKKLTQEEYSNLKPKDQVAYLLDSKRDELAKLIPSTLSIDRLIKVATIAATTTPGLMECSVPSLVSSIGTCIQLGFEPNTPLQHAFLVPFNKKMKASDGGKDYWVKLCQVIIGYRGLIDLAKRSGEVKNIAAHAVHENDEFSFEYGLNPDLKHKIDIRKDRGPIVAFYSFAKFKDGTDAFEVMTKAEVDEIMISTQSKGEYGPWKDNYSEMGRKTAIRRLSKYLPLSIEFQTAVALDIQAENGFQNIENIDGQYTVLPNDESPAVESKKEITMPVSKKAASQSTGGEEKKPQTESNNQVKTEAPIQKSHDVSADKNNQVPTDDLITEEQAKIMFDTLKDAGLQEDAFEEEYGFKVRQLPSRLYEGALLEIGELALAVNQ